MMMTPFARLRVSRTVDNDSAALELGAERCARKRRAQMLQGDVAARGHVAPYLDPAAGRRRIAAHCDGAFLTYQVLDRRASRSKPCRDSDGRSEGPVAK